MAKRRIAGFGWIRDLPDHRDQLFSARLETLRRLPQSVDLRRKCPPVYDQGRIGSCTANAIAAAIQFDRRRNKQRPDFVPSRLFIYYNERVMEGSVASDAGAQIRDGIKSVTKQGVCPEREWPYDDTPPPYDGGPFPSGSPAVSRPPARVYADARKYEAVQYQRLSQSLGQLKGCLAEGFPFVFGFSVYDSLYDPAGRPRKIVPLPSRRDRLLGGHAVLAVGYDDASQRFIVRNSWGRANQDKGYFYMPYAYVTDPSLAADLWVIRRISD